MASKSSTQRSSRTQAQRRAATYQQVLESACRLFGEQGYANTSLDDIANDCGLTTRPIYHYFGNKKALFAAANEAMEQRIIDAVYSGDTSGGLLNNWQTFLELCDDPHFRQIVLVDSPNVLGRERWATSAVTQHALRLFKQSERSMNGNYRRQLLSRMVMAAFGEAALVIAEAEDVALAKQQADAIVQTLFGSLDLH
ncbi:MAG: TetR/AcrR family transcriptional regulator [Halioglobus sp.]|jgi:AcrR family transcriptional regulator|nr:TetR/AcrR family transcriptional regulator [Halioglobus sp.]|tara:strand:- start:863 stop:1453 length:591 start_codon:yes stop_codon:yes gene_type:complete